MNEWFAYGGWVVALIAVFQWFNERRLRIFVQNYTTFGGTPLKKAIVHDSPEAEDRLEETLDKIEGIAATKRTGPQDGVFYDQQTLEVGVAWLLEKAQEDNTPLTEEQARHEAELMLNAQGTEM